MQLQYRETDELSKFISLTSILDYIIGRQILVLNCQIYLTILKYTYLAFTDLIIINAYYEVRSMPN